MSLKGAISVVQVTALACLCASLGKAQAADVVAFLQPDARTGTLPVDSIEIRRKEAVVPYGEGFQACDRVTFRASAKSVDQIRITTIRSGKNLALGPNAPLMGEVTIACDAPATNDGLLRMWRALSGGDRESLRLAATRGGMGPPPLELPILSSGKNFLIAGKRSLVIAWSGGTPPFSVWLKRGDSKVALVEHVAGQSVRLPVLDLQPGQYSLGVLNEKGDGLIDDQIFVVPASELPKPTTPVRETGDRNVDKVLLDTYFLEGVPGGSWAFEALQRAAAAPDKSPLLKLWLQDYGVR